MLLLRARLTDNRTLLREPMHHPDRLACLHERPRIYKLRCNGYTCTGCYLNFSPSNRIILREILIGIDRRKVARSPRKSYRCDSMLFSLKIKKREKDATTFPSSFSPCGISIRAGYFSRVVQKPVSHRPRSKVNY